MVIGLMQHLMQMVTQHTYILQETDMGLFDVFKKKESAVLQTEQPKEPEQAIHLEFDGMRIVDPEKCTGCGTCVENCPGGALGLAEE